jgi:hypothetical protein
MRNLMLQSFVALLRYDLFLRRHSFAELHEHIRRLQLADRAPEPADAAVICDAVAHACIWYPKHALCLQRSAVATTLLRRYGIPAQLVIGAQRLPLKSHAWVEVDGQVVNDKPQVQLDYLVLERC